MISLVTDAKRGVKVCLFTSKCCAMKGQQTVIAMAVEAKCYGCFICMLESGVNTATTKEKVMKNTPKFFTWNTIAT